MGRSKATLQALAFVAFFACSVAVTTAVRVQKDGVRVVDSLHPRQEPHENKEDTPKIVTAKVVDHLVEPKAHHEHKEHHTTHEKKDKPKIVTAQVVSHLAGSKHHSHSVDKTVEKVDEPENKGADWTVVSSNFHNATGIVVSNPKPEHKEEGNWVKVNQNYNATSANSTTPETTVTEHISNAALGKPTGPKLVHNAVVDKIRSYVDKEVDPCHDFYAYACGGWAEQTPMPSDQSEWGLADSEVEQDILEKIKVELENNENNIAGQYYASCMDEVTIANSGLSTLKDIFKMVDKIKTVTDLSHVVGLFHRLGVSPLWGWGITADEKHPDVQLFHMGQDGLSLPDKSYYTETSQEGVSLREEFVKHVSRMLQMVGVPEDSAVQGGYDVIELETAIAATSADRDAMRDPELLYNRYPYSELKQHFPDFDWSVYATSLQPSNFEGVRYGEINGPKKTSDLLETLLQVREGSAPSVEKPEAEAAPGPRPVDLRYSDVLIDVPEMFKNSTAMFKARLADKPHAVKFYLLYQLVKEYADYLPEEFYKEKFQFYGKQVNGAEGEKPRWKRCVLSTADNLSEALGQLYVAKYFSATTKTAAASILVGIEDAMRNRLKDVDWMDDATRQRALKKLDMVGNKVGYPSKWEDFTRLGMGKVFIKNALAATVFEGQRDFKRLGIKGDKTRWDMGVYEVNAYYDPSNNEMVFPAGILQPPMFDANMPDAFNYGGIGATMGHELTHGFDDDGAKFNGTGYMVNWWKNTTYAEFKERTKCIEDQYNDFLYRPGKHEDGKLTLGENIADNGGTRIAYHAFKAQKAKNGPTTIEGYTPEQLFFLAYGQGWCTKERVQAEVKQVTTDEHSLARFRVLGVVKNMPEFAEAFNCATDAPMNPSKKCTVW